MTQLTPPHTAVSGPAPGASIEILDEIETLIGEARRLPFSSNIVINEEEVLDLVDRARLGLPHEVVAAHNTLADSDAILGRAEEAAADTVDAAEAQAARTLEGARTEARRLVDDAQAAAARAVDEHEITREARERSAALVADAEREAGRIRTDADAYAREVMEELDTHLTRALTTVRKGLEALPRPEGEGRSRRRG